MLGGALGRAEESVGRPFSGRERILFAVMVPHKLAVSAVAVYGVARRRKVASTRAKKELEQLDRDRVVLA